MQGRSLRPGGLRRFSLAGLMLAVAVAAVLLAPLGSSTTSGRASEALPAAAGAIPAGAVVGFVVSLRYPRTRWWMRLFAILLGAATALLVAFLCLAGTDAHVLILGAVALLAITFGLRLFRVVRQEYPATTAPRDINPLSDRDD